jgi:putative acetyltransferase
MQKILIAPMTQAEVPVAKELLRTVWREHFGHEENAFVREFFNDPATLADLDDLRTNYFDANGTAVVVTEEDRLIGTGAVARLEEGVAELRRMFLLPAYRGRGIGKAVTEHLLAFARQKGYHTIRLGSHRNLHASHKLYERSGFRRIPAYDGNTNDLVYYFELELG